MSRSWERKVQKNMSALNKQRKKQGKMHIATGAAKVDRYVGRSYLLPLFLLFFIGLYVILSMMTLKEFNTMEWVTVAAYIVLALFFFLRRPYLAVGKDYVQTRKMSRDRVLRAADIKTITLSQGTIMIEPSKGANWIFSKWMNRYPTEEIASRMREFANANHIKLLEK
ncbi:hypothetical protein ACFSL6_11575 [Paenibacillus thailandensis]